MAPETASTFSAAASSTVLPFHNGSNVAAKIGVEETYIPQLERGAKLPSFDTLIYLANVLGVTPDELLCDYVEAETATVPNNIAKKMEKLNPKQRRHVEEMVDCMIAYMLEGK